jgi:WD40 repeat protein
MSPEVAQSGAIRPEDRLVAAFGSVLELVAWTSPDGQVMLASSGLDGTIRRWDATTGAEIGAPLQGSGRALTAWTGQDGHTALALDSLFDGIRLWDAATGEKRGEPLTEEPSSYPGSYPMALTAWTDADGHMMLASGREDGTIRCWDATSGIKIRELTPPPEPGRSPNPDVRELVAFTLPDGRVMLASGNADGTIRRWDTSTGDEVGASLRRGRFGRFRGMPVFALTAWTAPNGRVTLVSDRGNRGIRRWDAITGAEIRKPLTRRTGTVATALVAWTGRDDHMILAIGGLDGTIQRWDATTNVKIGKPLSGHTGSVNALVAWTGPGGHIMLASCSNDGTIRRWDATTGGKIGEPLTGHSAGVEALTAWISPDGYPMLASKGQDEVVRRWNASTLTPWGDPPPPIRLLGDIVASTGPNGHVLIAAAGYDGIRCWDATTGTTIGKLLTGDGGRIAQFRRSNWAYAALTAWTSPDGHIRLASGNPDGTIQRWDLTTGTPIGRPLTRRSNKARLTQLIAWTGTDGVILASLTSDDTIQCWDATTDKPLMPRFELTDRSVAVKTIAAWTGRDGPVLASGHDNGTIRRWDAVTGTEISKPLTGHTGGVRALAAWTDPDGRIMLASGSDDDTIRRWDATTGEQIGGPLTGHTGGVQALAAWTDPGGHIMLASGDGDGVIHVWDTVTGQSLSRVPVDPIRLRGLADRPARHDLLSRSALTQALANQLLWRPAEPGGETGPSVVTIEGPWGTGKTTIMQLVKSRITAEPENQRSNRHLSVAAARKILHRAEITDAPRSNTTPMEYRGALTAWFNAWVSQSSEQVWAGLARSITDAAKPVLWPDEAEAQAQAYWLARNTPRIDRFAVGRSMLLRIVSPLLGFSAVIAVATVLISLAKLNSGTLFHVGHRRVTLDLLALAIAVAFLLAGLVHTMRRYYGPVGQFLPPDLVHGPVLSNSFGADTSEALNLLRDPVYLAKSGYLSIVQADTATTVRDLRNSGYDLVVFVDDLDRCSARTTAEVFEALNLFLSDTNLEVKFVIGLDPAVVAARLDDVYKDDNHLLQYGDDPSAGWAFLRKVVQLPVAAPHVTDVAVDQFLGAAFGVSVQRVQESAGIMDARLPANEDKKMADSAESLPLLADHLPDISETSEKEEKRTASLERQPEILALMRQRLAAQPGRSARETKRLLNVWQLYQRVLDLEAPLHDTEEVVRRSRHLAILAEIITRWPALQSRLNQSWEGRRGLQILAAACANDDWTDALKITGLDKKEYMTAVTNLRELLRAYNGIEVADLAEKVL